MLLWILAGLMVFSNAIDLYASSRELLSGYGHVPLSMIVGLVKSFFGPALLLAVLGYMVELLDQIRRNVRQDAR